jgi:hypothetical protein
MTAPSYRISRHRRGAPTLEKAAATREELAAILEANRVGGRLEHVVAEVAAGRRASVPVQYAWLYIEDAAGYRPPPPPRARDCKACGELTYRGAWCSDSCWAQEDNGGRYD